MPLEPEDQQHLTRAEGYLELGMYLDANAELEEIDPDVRHVPEVLAIRVHIYSALKQWELMQTVAKKLAQHDPDNPAWPVSWAYATRRVDSIEAAKTILLSAVERFSDEAIFHYNLACYECQHGQLEEAKVRLKRQRLQILILQGHNSIS
jgi:predicted Zn-dependent protease